jgi:hypothetical protein
MTPQPTRNDSDSVGRAGEEKGGTELLRLSGVGSACCSVVLQKGLFAIVLQQIKGCLRENKIGSGLSKAGSHCGNIIQLKT